MTGRKFYRKTFELEILSEEPIGDPSLGTITYEITKGDWSGQVKELSSEQLDGAQVAQLLLAQGSSPEFFWLNDKGEDLY